MTIGDGNMIGLFAGGGIFCWLLVALMLAYIRRQQRGTGPMQYDEDLQDQIDQLMLARATLDEDHQTGQLSDSDFAATCLDIDRRLLGLSQQVAQASASSPKDQTLTRLAVGLAIILPLGAALIYATLGRPDLRDNPLVDRAAEIASRSETITATKENLAQNLARAQAATVATPDDIESWLKLAEAAASVNDSATEIRALRMARQLTNDDPSVLSLLAEALSRAADGQVTVPARDLIDTVLATDPDEPRALFLSGLAAFQDGDYQAAVTRWQRLLSISTADAPWLPIVRANIAQAAEAGGIALPPANGPDADSIAAAADMTAKDRQAMILSMVESLRDRLDETPDDTEGWLRLARAYDVLGDRAAAFTALARATESAPDDAPLAYQFLERTIGIELSAAQLSMAQTVIARLAENDTNGPQYLFFKGHIAKLSGDTDTARSVWTDLLGTMPAESEMAAALAAEIAKLN
ncbi:MAG: c-type cytochrome biogenesis protein CcmI [Candidatus Puniceispirillaceae bacterium]|jgi:cytochrome c-type biogenesis protein CcmH